MPDQGFEGRGAGADEAGVDFEDGPEERVAGVVGAVFHARFVHEHVEAGDGDAPGTVSADVVSSLW